MEFFDQLQEKLAVLGRLMEDLQGALAGTPVPRKLRESIDLMRANHTRFLQDVGGGDLDALSQAARGAAVYGVFTSQHIASIPSLSEEVKEIGRRLGEEAQALQIKAHAVVLDRQKQNISVFDKLQ